MSSSIKNTLLLHSTHKLFQIFKDFMSKWTCTAGVPASGALIREKKIVFFPYLMLNANKLRPTREYTSGKRTYCLFYVKKPGDARKNNFNHE
jgi:hypothetical protein